MSNELNIDLEDKIVRIKDGGLFHCKSGFGCKPTTNGRKIYGDYLTNEGVKMYEGMISGYDVVSLVNDDNIAKCDCPRAYHMLFENCRGY